MGGKGQGAGGRGNVGRKGEVNSIRRLRHERQSEGGGGKMGKERDRDEGKVKAGRKVRKGREEGECEQV